MADKTIHLRISSHPENLRQVRAMMAQITAGIQISREEAGAVILAVDEACSNIIKHCCTNDPLRQIDVTVCPEADSLVIIIVDDGILFDINTIISRDIHDIRPGGLGVYIIRQIMDTVEYSHTPEGHNQIRMVKKLGHPQSRD